MTIGTMSMKACPFCGSLDIDPQAWGSQNEEDGPIVHGPGCMDCGAMAKTVRRWNDRFPLIGEAETAEVSYRTDLAMHEENKRGELK